MGASPPRPPGSEGLPRSPLAGRPLAFGKREGEVFLGREIGQRQDYSEQTAIEIDAEVRRIVFENYERARKVLLDNLDTLKAIAEALLEYETLDTSDIDVLMGGGKIERKPPNPPPVPARDKEAAKKEKRSLFAPSPILDPEKA